MRNVLISIATLLVMASTQAQLQQSATAEGPIDTLAAVPDGRVLACAVMRRYI